MSRLPACLLCANATAMTLIRRAFELVREESDGWHVLSSDAYDSQPY